MTDFFKIPAKLYSFTVKYFFSITFKFFCKKRKIPLYTFDTFLEVAAPAKLPYYKTQKTLIEQIHL